MKQNITKTILLALMLCPIVLHAQTDSTVRTSLSTYFAGYKNPSYNGIDRITVENMQINEEGKILNIYLNKEFGNQPFTPALVQKTYQDVKRLLPMPYNTYELVIYADTTPIEELIPANLLDVAGSSRVYPSDFTNTKQWITSLSLPYSIKNGLQGRHLCLWASHGKYYKSSTQAWEWQRPHLYCTTEDLYTQTFVIPYLIPMLQNAGAIVYTPRERDWQKLEYIVDNDHPDHSGLYTEFNGKYEWTDAGIGFACNQEQYQDDENPFQQGTCRQTEAMSGRHLLSTVTYTPQITHDGDYAVYISYKTLPTSVIDAHYTVRHGGVATSFKVNQQMGGGTWVYLGTFHFTTDRPADNNITLTNQSNYRGTITADAVRLGGGMGNVLRRDSTMEVGVGSQLPRCLEAARYSSLWYGIPDTLYDIRHTDDYSDDINSRPFAANYLSGGSVYNPAQPGLGVPIELSMAVHSDAGYRRDGSIVGTLGIYTSDFYDGKTAAGLSRLTSRDLADNVMTQINQDITSLFGTWNRRQMYDRNYGETRDPQMPGIILETMSHQNFADMRLGHDPYFKYHFSRAVYKGILRYLCNVHQTEDYVVVPLPVTDLTAVVDTSARRITLSWKPTTDQLEPSARPTDYIIYTAQGDGDFDNGVRMSADDTHYTLDALPGVLYRFRVSAVNKGGCSTRSDEVCAYLVGPGAPTILVADGFQRVAGPQPVSTDSICGFDMSADPGVIDVKSCGFCGYQKYFLRDGYDHSGETATGYSGSELEGLILQGNTHDYTTWHARDILSGGKYNISSCSLNALTGLDTRQFQLIDAVLGAQKDDGYSLRTYKTFTARTQETLKDYTRNGGSLLVSGAYIGSDMQSDADRYFTRQVLKYHYTAANRLDSINTVQGTNLQFTLWNQPNEEHYWVRSVDVIEPDSGAFSSLAYTGSYHSASVAYNGSDYKVMTYGFPLECIRDDATRRRLFTDSVNFLLNK